MRLIRGLKNLRPADHGCVATIGNFDGIHLGHRAVLQNLLHHSRTLGLPATVITFEPQPLEFFAPDTAPPRLTKLREKLTAVRNLGIERVMVLEFNFKLASLDAQLFVKKLLIDGLGVRFLLVGDDFRFGRGRRGDLTLLRSLGNAIENINARFIVASIPTITHGAERISSTRIREALARGELQQAQQLLGRPYSLEGRVVHGKKLGRSLGFPTANLLLHRYASPLQGVFAVMVHGIGQTAVPGVANLGSRPTLNGCTELLEIHLFDFNQVIYGYHLRVEFLLKLRAELRFASLAELQQQIQLDVHAARAYFGLKN